MSDKQSQLKSSTLYYGAKTLQAIGVAGGARLVAVPQHWQPYAAMWRPIPVLAAGWVAANRANEFGSNPVSEFGNQLYFNTALKNDAVENWRSRANKRAVAGPRKPIAKGSIIEGATDLVTKPKPLPASPTSIVDKIDDALAGTKPGDPYWQRWQGLSPAGVDKSPTKGIMEPVYQKIQNSVARNYNRALPNINRMLAPASAVLGPTSTKPFANISEAIASTRTSASRLDDALDDLNKPSSKGGRIKKAGSALYHAGRTGAAGTGGILRTGVSLTKGIAGGMAIGAAGSLTGQGIFALASAGDSNPIADAIGVDQHEFDEHIDDYFEGAGSYDPLTLYARAGSAVHNLWERQVEQGLHDKGGTGDWVQDQVTEGVDRHLTTDRFTQESDPLMHDIMGTGALPDEIAAPLAAATGAVSGAVVGTVESGVEAASTAAEETAQVVKPKAKATDSWLKRRSRAVSSKLPDFLL